MTPPLPREGGGGVKNFRSDFFFLWKWSEMARNLLGSLFWHYDHPPPLTPITPVTPVFMSKGHGRGGGGKFFYQKIFSSRNDLIWRENWLAPWHHGWHHGWHHVGTMVGFLAPWSPPLVGRVGGGATKFLAKKYFLPEMVWNGEKVVVSLFVKDQASMLRPFWDNSSLFFLLCCSIWDEHSCMLV